MSDDVLCRWVDRVFEFPEAYFERKTKSGRAAAVLCFPIALPVFLLLFALTAVVAIVMAISLYIRGK